ncbi:hypothetical protein [Bradyrhizobium sp. CCBAU 51753]|uniref:hypothetical protein n=1 Tax=Bradyrhizobium sp. CCBAU 51753 TaxID=1325100 RepID=UPI00188CA5EF|nr:hypothetical protein [Bradyrhizobium sp. CCBAU 51753]QOZ28131.1 hypothetical protein XH93_34360 [Bradyrhizobium sp. CCBAU 51753]
MIEEYVKAYRNERNRAESNARKQRVNLEKDRTTAKAKIQRVVTAIAKGIISDSEASDLLSPLRADLAKVEAELALAETHTNVIELHPKAVRLFKKNLEDLAEILKSGASPDLALIARFRSLVENVIVRPREAGDEYEVQIKGRLAALMGVEGVSAIKMVAGAFSLAPISEPDGRAKSGLEPATSGARGLNKGLQSSLPGR